MFRDEAVIEVVAGKGGNGLISFHREKYVAFGGPNGGDGGDGGSVTLRADPSVSSLLSIGRQFRYAAAKGRPGGTNCMTGARGASLEMTVPVGTQIFDEEHGNLLCDLTEPGQEVVVAKGGHGGKGNVHFANSVRQVPRHATPGGEGEKRRIQLVLKLFAEVGLIGLPNAGKSTFIGTVTAARPKVAAYPFTTLVPEVGIAQVGDYDTLVIADLPGLIEGAADGTGLGFQFLKHVERCRVLLHLVDCSPGADTEPVEALRVLERELANYSEELKERPRIVVASKCEDDTAEERAAELEQAVGVPVLRMSSATGKGLKEVLREARRVVRGEVDQVF